MSQSFVNKQTTSEKISDFLSSSTDYSSVIIREKAQYRIFSFKQSQRAASAKGLIATKVLTQGSGGIEWSSLVGIKAYVADSTYSGTSEEIGFANDDGYG